MADFNITLDTIPMAQSIDTVNGNVQGTTTAVVAMHAAVIAEEHATSQQICQNVDNGFYILMKSQLSQKIAACSSTMSSKLMQMKKFRSDINHIQEVMQSDYNRICRRYQKLFTSLDKALEARIHELDRAAMEIGIEEKRMFGKLRDDSACVVCYDGDTQVTAQKSITAKVKSKTGKAIAAMGAEVIDRIVYNRKVEHILEKEKVDSNADSYVPVIVEESDSMFDMTNKVNNVYVPQTECFTNTDIIANQVQSTVQENEWKPVVKEEYDQVQNSFMKCCTESGLEERVVKEMIRLFGSSTWTVPQKERSQ